MRRSRALGAALGALMVAGAAIGRTRLRRFEVTEDSMAPALRDGDYVIATRLVSAPLRGDIIVFPHPRSPGFLMIKRVVGLPGETLRIDNGRTVANGHVLAEPWAHGSPAGEYAWHLDGRHLIVISDNRSLSTEDSRELGPLPVGDLWRVGFRYWPIGRIGPVR